MRWIALIAFGVLGWVAASGAITVRITRAAWMHGWQGVAVGAVAVVAVVSVIPIFLAAFEPLCSICGEWIQNLAADAEAVSMKYCGKKNGWIYHAIKWAAVLWFLPFVAIIGTVLNGGSE